MQALAEILQVGQEIQYEQPGKRAGRGVRVDICRGRVVQVTPAFITIQGDKYPDSIALADLITGATRLISPALDLTGLELRNRITRNDPKLERRRLGVSEKVPFNEPGGGGHTPEKYPWATLDIEGSRLWAQGETLAAIALAIGVPVKALGSHIEAHRDLYPRRRTGEKKRRRGGAR